jgi:hypothetical protein
MASEKIQDHVIMLDSYDVLKTLEDRISQNVCREP